MVSRFGNIQTNVACPNCRQGALMAQLFCRHTTLECTLCQSGYTFAELAIRLDDETFERLAAIVEGRLSDRV